MVVDGRDVIVIAWTAVLKPAAARDVKLARFMITIRCKVRPQSGQANIPDPMDEEDQFGIPSDYYSHYSGATPRHYSENFPTSSFDEFLDDELEPFADKPFEDFGDYMRVIFDWVQLFFY